MTSHYVDIRAIGDPETSAVEVLSIVFDKLHLALVKQRIADIGVSFPGYSLNPRSLGVVVRLHGTQAQLQAFVQHDWLKGLRSHVQLTDVMPVPTGATYRTVQRKQFKTNADRLRRRRMKRKGETQEQAAKAIPSTVERKPDLPYLHALSRSTQQPYHLFIALGPLQNKPITGTFNSHGLSGTSTIPWF